MTEESEVTNVTNVSTLSVKLSTVVAIVSVIAAILGSWYSTNAKLTMATEQLVAMRIQMDASQKDNDRQHEKLATQAREMELKLYGAIVTLKVKRILE